MGADLYIPKIHDPLNKLYRPFFDDAVAVREALPRDTEAHDKAQKLVTHFYDKMDEEGYFRDSYNSTSVLWTLDLSWWQDLEPDIDDEDSEINVSAERCREFLEKIKAAKQVLPDKDKLIANHASVDDDEHTVESWHEYYREKRERLIKFFEQAIKAGGMRASC